MQKGQKGRFITIEGVEGVGKSTAVTYLETVLLKAGIDAVVTREPGGTVIAERIREVLLNAYPEKMTSDTELLLMFAGRMQNIAHVIKPALARGQWVICDRFVDASFAYQGGGRQLPMTHIETLAQWVADEEVWPDLTLLLDAPIALGFKRMAQRTVKDRIEKEGLPFFERVRQVYLERAKADPERFRLIDASAQLIDVRRQLDAAVSPLIAELPL